MGFFQRFANVQSSMELTRLRKQGQRNIDTELQAARAQSYQQGHGDGWAAGWRAGQADLINRLRTGQVRLDQL